MWFFREGVWGNGIEFLTGDVGRDSGVRERGRPDPFRLRFVGDFNGDLEGDAGGAGSLKGDEADLGEAAARVWVSEDTFEAGASCGRSANGICGTGEMPE